MQDRFNPETMMAASAAGPSKDMTMAEFTALGANALVYVRAICGAVLTELLADPSFESDAIYQLIVSADGSPLLVADNPDAASEWVDEMNLGVVTLH